VVRTTQQTGNLSVILVGGGLFVILAFALTTELFAKNSPSVLYAQAVDMIRASDTVSDLQLPTSVLLRPPACLLSTDAMR
jgi:import inner membrane translocase subunit TIM21